MNSAPPKIASANPRFAIIIVGLLAMGIGATVFFFNPSSHSFYPVCQFHRITGWNCPGCGGTRALYALLHGNFSAAVRDNALFIFGLAAMVIRGAWFGVKYVRGQTMGEFFPAKFLWPLLALTVVFTVLRNLPAFAFLSP